MRRVLTTRATFNTGAILVGKTVQYLSALVFVVIVPRLLGTVTYGRFGLLTALLLLGLIASDLGVHRILGRYVPEMLTQGQSVAVRALFTQLMLVKMGAALLASALFLVVGHVLMPTLKPWLLVMAALSLLLRSAAETCYHLAFGLNRMGQWIAREALRGALLLVTVVTLFHAWGFEGAVVAILLTDLCLFLLGMFWARRWFIRPTLDLHWLRPYLNFGCPFFLALLCLTAFQRGGHVLITLLHGDVTQVAYFDLALNVYLMAHMTFVQIALSAIPTLTLYHVHGRFADIASWLRFLSKMTGAAGVVVCAVVLALGETLIPLVFGLAYTPTVRPLQVIVLGLLPLAVSQMGAVVATVHKQPRIALLSAVALTTAFVLFSLLLIPLYGALGAAIAVAGAMVIYAVAVAWLCQSYLVLPWRELAGIVLPVLLLLPAYHWPPGPEKGSFLLVGFLTVYTFLILKGRLLVDDDRSWSRCTFTGQWKRGDAKCPSPNTKKPFADLEIGRIGQ